MSSKDLLFKIKGKEMCPESVGVLGYVPSKGKSSKKGPPTYKAAKPRASDRGKFANLGQKPKTDKKIGKVDSRVKKVTNKIFKFKSKNTGPAAYSQSYRGNEA